MKKCVVVSIAPQLHRGGGGAGGGGSMIFFFQRCELKILHASLNLVCKIWAFLSL